MADFSEKVKQYGSVAAALAASGYTKSESGGWRKDPGSGGSAPPSPSSSGSSGASSTRSDPAPTSGGTRGGASGGNTTRPAAQPASSGSASRPAAQPASAGYAAPAASQLPALNQYGYRDIDYSEVLPTVTDPVLKAQLQDERLNKIHYQYGDAEPYMTGTTQRFSETAPGRKNTPVFDNNFSQTTFTPGMNYADEAARHAAAGDWGAVEKDLLQRQAKINAQGGNNRGLTNEQLLAQLRSQYGASFDQMSQRDQDRLTLISGGKAPFTNYAGDQGNIYLGSGWHEGVNYLARAQDYARAGDLDGAYEALMRRGFKMYDTGSTGNGISQDQAYAMIDNIWRTSPAAQESYQREMEKNAQWIADSGARAGNPGNAYKTLRKGNYWITYDGNGVPVIAGRVSSNLSKQSKAPSYSPEQIDYLAKYYAGEAGDYAQAYIPAHNIMVMQTGTGRLIDQYGNYASGESSVPTNAKGYTGHLYAPGVNTNQDRGSLQAIQDRINAGEQFGALGPDSAGKYGSVPIATTVPLPGNSVTGGGGPGGGISGGGLSGGVSMRPGVADIYTPDSMGDYLDQWYQSAQQQQTNTIDYGTNQAILELQRAQQDAEAMHQEQRNQIAIDEAKAKDNQALYAETRGDKGGIGAAQYDTIMNTAAQNRLAVNSAQTKLATDTSRQIADLRAQGEYEKADALLQLSQQYLGQLMSLEQWAAEYNLSVAQFNASLQQWQAEYDMKMADLLGSYNGAPTLSAQQFAFNQQQYADAQRADQEAKLASAGEILLSNGIVPSASQLAAMGMTETDAQSYITAQKVAAAAAKKGSGGSGGGGSGGGGGTETPGESIYQQLYNAGIRTYYDAYAQLVDAGYNATNADRLANGLVDKIENGDFSHAVPGIAPENAGASRNFGTSYSSIWNRARTMFDQGKKADEIAAFLDKFSETQLTKAGLEYIMDRLNLEKH